jgi:hypothetical protein
MSFARKSFGNCAHSRPRKGFHRQMADERRGTAVTRAARRPQATTLLAYTVGFDDMDFKAPAILVGGRLREHTDQSEHACHRRLCPS